MRRILKETWREDKKLIFWIIGLCMLLITLNSVSALTPEANGVSYYNFSSVTDLWGSNDATNVGAVSNAAYPSFNISGNSSPSSFDFVATESDYISANTAISDYPFTMNSWIKPDSTGVTGSIMGFTDASDAAIYYVIDQNSFAGAPCNGNCFIMHTRNVGSVDLIAGTPTTDWTMITGVWTSATDRELYVNGVSVGTSVTSIAFSAGVDKAIFGVQRLASPNSYFNGLIDEVKIYNKTLNTTEITNLYNYGTILGVVDTNNFTITAVDYLGNALSNFSVVIDGTDTYNTTTGTLITNIYNNDSSLHSFVVDSDGYASITETNYNVSFNYAATLYPEDTINITFLYEENNTLASGINITVEFISDSFSVETNTSNGVLNYTLGYPDDYIIRFTANNLTRLYDFTLEADTFDELTLYVPGDDSEVVFINVFDSFQYPIVGATVKVLKYFVSSNSFVQISSQETNFEGQTSEYIELDNNFYQFLVEINGVNVLTTSSTYVFESPVNLYATTLVSGFDTLFSITGFYGVISFNTSTNVVSYTWDDEDNLATQGCLYVYRNNGITPVLVNSSCSSGAAGSLSLNLASYNASYHAKGYITKGGNNYFLTQKYFSIGSEENFNDNDSLLLVAFIIIVMFFIGYFAIELAMVLSGVAVLFTSIVGIFNIGLGVAIPVFVLSLVLAYIISRYRRGGFL